MYSKAQRMYVLVCLFNINMYTFSMRDSPKLCLHAATQRHKSKSFCVVERRRSRRRDAIELSESPRRRCCVNAHCVVVVSGVHGRRKLIGLWVTHKFDAQLTSNCVVGLCV